MCFQSYFDLDSTHLDDHNEFYSYLSIWLDALGKVNIDRKDLCLYPYKSDVKNHKKTIE